MKINNFRGDLTDIFRLSKEALPWSVHKYVSSKRQRSEGRVVGQTQRYATTEPSYGTRQYCRRPVESIVVDRRLFDIAGGPPNMYIVVYIHRVYKWYIRYVYGIYGGSPAKTKSQKWRPPTTMVEMAENWSLSSSSWVSPYLVTFAVHCNQCCRICCNIAYFTPKNIILIIKKYIYRIKVSNKKIISLEKNLHWLRPASMMSPSQSTGVHRWVRLR